MHVSGMGHELVQRRFKRQQAQSQASCVVNVCCPGAGPFLQRFLSFLHMKSRWKWEDGNVAPFQKPPACATTSACVGLVRSGPGSAGRTAEKELDHKCVVEAQLMQPGNLF